MRLAAIILAAGLTDSCDLSDDLEGEPCAVQRDCWHEQECARTDAERELDLPGICAEKGTGCTPGQQLGCACVPDEPDMDCSFTIVPTEMEYPDMTCDPSTRVCVPATETEG